MKKLSIIILELILFITIALGTHFLLVFFQQSLKKIKNSKVAIIIIYFSIIISFSGSYYLKFSDNYIYQIIFIVCLSASISTLYYFKSMKYK